MCTPNGGRNPDDNQSTLRINLGDVPLLKGQLAFIDIIGSGHYSEVKKARDNKQELVAVKCIPLDQMTKEMRLISREVSILTAARHPHIVRYIGCFRDNEFFYLTMELCTGGNLRESIDASGPLPEARVREIARETVSALAYLHSLDIAHRDIKPENILFDSEMHVKLADFGLSRHLTQPDRLTVVGTPYYLAPEMIQGKYSIQCDMWSLGVVLYFAMVGKLPFTGEDFGGLFNQIRTATITNWGVCSEAAVDFIRALLVRSPSRRMTAESAKSHVWLSRQSPAV